MELFLEKIRETELAIMVTDGVKTVWLPKSQIEIFAEEDKYVRVEVPEWLLKTKELI